MANEERSYKKIESQHLLKLKEIALTDQNNFFKHYPDYIIFKDKLYAVLLVQGASKHYVDGITGIKDFDILVLYKENTSNNKCICYRRMKSYDCGMPNFGRYPKDRKKYSNRRVDIRMGEIGSDVTRGNDLKTSLKNYFKEGKTKSIKKWRKKAVIGIYPKEILGEIIFSS